MTLDFSGSTWGEVSALVTIIGVSGTVYLWIMSRFFVTRKEYLAYKEVLDSRLHEGTQAMQSLNQTLTQTNSMLSKVCEGMDALEKSVTDIDRRMIRTETLVNLEHSEKK